MSAGDLFFGLENEVSENTDTDFYAAGFENAGAFFCRAESEGGCWLQVGFAQIPGLCGYCRNDQSVRHCACRAQKKGGAIRGRPQVPSDSPRGYALREYGAHREDNGQPFCLRRAFHFEITRRNVLPSARKAGMSAAPAETRDSQGKGDNGFFEIGFSSKKCAGFRTTYSVGNVRANERREAALFKQTKRAKDPPRFASR